MSEAASSAFRKQCRGFAGQLENLVHQRDRAVDSFGRHLMGLKELYSLRHSREALKGLERRGFFSEENVAHSWQVIGVGLNHLLCEQILRDARLNPAEKAALRRVYRAYALMRLQRFGDLEPLKAFAESKRRQREYHERIFDLVRLSGFSRIQSAAEKKLGTLGKALGRIPNGSHLKKTLMSAFNDFNAFLDDLQAHKHLRS